MKILVVSPFLPYSGVSHAGGKLVHHLLSMLCEYHEITLVTRVFPGEEKHFEGLRSLVAGLETVPSDGPVVPGKVFSILRTVLSYYRLARKAREVMAEGRFDLCQVEFTETALFFRPSKDIPAALTLHDVKAKPAFRKYRESRGMTRLLRWVSWKVTVAVERYATSRFGAVFTLSDIDREWARRHYGDLPIRVLRYPAGLGFRGIRREEVPGRILFLGAMNRPENVDGVRYLMRHVWPVVRRRHPEAELWIAGGGIGDELREELSADPRIRVTGWVESVEPLYASAAVFVAPVLAGGGIIVKVQDALAAGTPVVTTPYGNEGIGGREGMEILVAEQPEDFLDGVLTLLDDPERRKRIGEAGKRFIRGRFSEEAFRETLFRTYRELAM